METLTIRKADGARALNIGAFKPEWNHQIVIKIPAGLGAYVIADGMTTYKTPEKQTTPHPLEGQPVPMREIAKQIYKENAFVQMPPSEAGIRFKQYYGADWVFVYSEAYSDLFEEMGLNKENQPKTNPNSSYALHTTTTGAPPRLGIATASKQSADQVSGKAEGVAAIMAAKQEAKDLILNSVNIEQIKADLRREILQEIGTQTKTAQDQIAETQKQIAAVEEQINASNNEASNPATDSVAQEEVGEKKKGRPAKSKGELVTH